MIRKRNRKYTNSEGILETQKRKEKYVRLTSVTHIIICQMQQHEY